MPRCCPQPASSSTSSTLQSGWGVGTTSQDSLFSHTPEDLASRLNALGQPAYRARQVLTWAFRGVLDYQSMSDLPSGLRAQLQEDLPLWTLSPLHRSVSTLGDTEKAVFHLPDGALIETVRMEHATASGRLRTTICVSSQAGCAYGCRFCATGQQGYGRNLTPGEIVQQVVWWSRQDERPAPDGRAVTNVVFMGMGEPFANYEATMAAVRTLNAPWGLGLGARHITVSTVGLVPEIRRFAGEPLQVNLAVSLHASNDPLRSDLMPVNRKYPLAQLMTACRKYASLTRRRVTFEYVLLGGVNDSLEHARELARLLSGLLAHVNVIPVNPTSSDYVRPEPRVARAFVEEVSRHGVPTTLRDTQGVDIQAGCGQLRARSPLPAGPVIPVAAVNDTGHRS